MGIACRGIDTKIYCGSYTSQTTPYLLPMQVYLNELQVGEREVLKNETTMALRWVDKRQVVMLTTQHSEQIE
ncbi:hypothetical protein J6590_011145 [Homalodisca vitripennis]|nr:hypothetical protein J6590_011145 [Homalodisca vitripennis]